MRSSSRDSALTRSAGVETNLGEQDNRRTTAVTGFYGQNVPYSGFAQPTGFFTSAVATVVGSGGLLP
jgi:hypothetical protein